jgi:hypothetical protein
MVYPVGSPPVNYPVFYRLNHPPKRHTMPPGTDSPHPPPRHESPLHSEIHRPRRREKQLGGKLACNLP